MRICAEVADLADGLVVLALFEIPVFGKGITSTSSMCLTVFFGSTFSHTEYKIC